MGYMESILLGISLAAVPGPIFFETMRRTLARGFFSGALVSVGEFLANLLLLLLIYFGVSVFLLYAPLKVVLFLVGSTILVWLGLSATKLKEQDIVLASRKNVSSSNSLLVGFSLAISSPIAIALWISINGSYLSQFPSQPESLINMFLLAFGVMLFFLIFSFAISLTRNRIHPKYVVMLSKLFGAVLICYGLYFLYQFAASLI